MKELGPYKQSEQFTGTILGIIELLLESGANLEAKNQEAKNQFGYSPLYAAACTGELEAVKLLLKKGANMEAVNNRGKTPLYGAFRCARG